MLYFSDLKIIKNTLKDLKPFFNDLPDKEKKSTLKKNILALEFFKIFLMVVIVKYLQKIYLKKLEVIL